MRKSCSSLREHAKRKKYNVPFPKKKKMLSLTKKELKLHEDVTARYICGTRFPKKFTKDKKYGKVRDHCHFTGK